ncbi:hypothetical protein CERSUDRAFT_105050 [Gelatoporia subvermispora B]|uniref:Palmitoyltransferase n=1 Tax=Ceriporiopsis subvermispora (strain B) TaxID=914234 RepID=M2QN66_CERS8|nr:hypothetical protein CERSUDRAFT_105050 [Gelatoporia subvermispora B]
MATPHSLPPNPQRTNLASKLPFSPSQSNAARIPGAARPGRSGSITSNLLNRSGSVVSTLSRPPQKAGYTREPQLPTSTSLPAAVQPRPIPSNTHTNGILPSASFFHPSRPGYPPPSPSPTHHDSVISIEATTFDGVRLAPLTEHRSRESDGSGSLGHTTEEFKDPSLTPPSRTTNLKQSREPLLPIGRQSTSGGTTRPTIVTSGTQYGRSETNVSAGGRMRDSFEKIFKRRFSMDSNRKSPTSAGPSNVNGAFAVTSQPPHRSTQASPVSPSTVARMTFDLNVPDKDGIPISPQSHKRVLSSPHMSSRSVSQYSFIPNPPPGMNPPRSAIPTIDVATGKPKRNYELHPSRNRFFLHGHILTGGDSPWAFIASLCLVLGITGVWFGTTCVWWWLNESPAVAAVGAYMCLLTISSMLATAFSDPGILPRDLDPDPPYPSGSSSEGSLRAPLPRDLKVRAGVVRTKYCATCRTYRPPRSSHCKMCDNCVDGCDHHCQWVNNCVGRRNYTSFFTFLFSGVLTLILVICTTALHLYLLIHKFHMSFRDALATSQGVGSAVAFSLSILVIWPVFALLAYHLRLLLLNVTTIEQIRNQAHKSLVPGPAPPNPFSHGTWRRNVVYMLCRPPGYSWLNPRGIATEDKREINPGLLQEAWLHELEEGRRGKGE